jgi:hypothetical protein
MRLSKNIRRITGCLLVGLALIAARGHAAEGTNASVTRPPFSTFKTVTEKNIFNTKRSPKYVPTEIVNNRRPTRSDSIALVGVMDYEKGSFAFFEGSSGEYNKVLKTNDSIGGFKLTTIEPRAVKLASPTNEFAVKVGMQLSRQDEGAWHVSERPENLDTGGTRSVATSWTAKPAVPRTENPPSGQQDGGFPFPGGGIPDQILQAIQGNLPGGGRDRGGGNDQNGPGTNVVPAPSAAPAPGSGESPDAILQRLIQRRQQENN